MKADASESLSARRAWIEILFHAACNVFCFVALRKESVDRNNRRFGTIHNAEMSLSARRAWIEIRRALGFVDPDKVALRKESVDRNSVMGLRLPTIP